MLNQIVMWSGTVTAAVLALPIVVYVVMVAGCHRAVAYYYG